MGENYLFQNPPISNWSESLEKDLLLPVHDSNPVVGVVGKENIVLAVEKTVTDPRSATNTLPLDNTGMTLTCRYAPFLVEMVQIEIEDSERFPEYSFPISPEYVAWVTHPSGMVRKCGAHAIGRDFELRNEFLLKNYNYEETSGKKAVKLAIRALLEVILLNDHTESRTIKLELHLPQPCIDMEIIYSSEQYKHKQDSILSFCLENQEVLMPMMIV